MSSLTTPSLLDVIYWAGLFEGEGSVTIHGSRARRRKNPSYSLVALINMCDKEPLDRLQEFWGGFQHVTHNDQGTRPFHRWTVSARQAAAFLGAIRPYLQTARYQTKVDLGLAFQAQKGKPGAVTDEYRARQQKFKDAMLLLNGSGFRALTTEERFDTVRPFLEAAA